MQHTNTHEDFSMDHQPHREVEDEKVREMMRQAGFDVTVSDDVRAFARLMRAMFAWHEDTHRQEARKGNLRMALIVGAATTAISVIIPLILKKLGVL